MAIMIRWTFVKRKRLARVVASLTESGKPNGHAFEFDGHQFTLGYAQYLLEYLNAIHQKQVKNNER